MLAKPRILYLEDDADLGSITAEVLEKEGFDVTWIKNGADGLTAFSKNHFDICIVDIMMPRLDGYSFVRTIRASNAALPVIFLSARVLTEDVVKGFETGGDDYMRKPFGIDELIARVNRLLNKGGLPQPGKQWHNIGKYLFCSDSLELKNGANKVYLSPRAGELLYRLVTNKHNLLPRSKTLTEVWGEDTFFNGRSLDVFISKLRKQLAGDNAIRIVNIRAEGYKLIVDSQ